VTEALRLALGTLTVVAVPPPARVDRRVGGLAMALAPAVGALLGAVAALVLWAGGLVLGELLAALLAVGALAVLTRLIHWDGLADLADGLGSGRPADGALQVMRRGDVGPFGVVAVVAVLGVQVAATAEVGPAGLVAAVVLGRWGLPLACRSGVPAARPDGLGAAVAGAVTGVLLAAAGTGTLLLLAVVGYAGPVPGLALVAAAVAATAWAIALAAVAVRRLGGITGDVLGAVVESTTAVALLTLAAWT